MSLLLEQVWDTIVNTFANIFAGIGQAFSYHPVVTILMFTILLALIIYRVIRNKHTTEVKTYKAITKINDYLSKHPFITEENIVEFNRLMMSCPKTIRFQWQRYVINRDRKPSEFLSEENCVSRPLRTNSYKQGLRNFLFSSLGLFVFSASFIIASFVSIDAQVGMVFRGLIAPCLALLVSLLYSVFGNVYYNAIMTDLYYSYTQFEKNIDRAVVNMPEAIDYEIIFTPKEIKNGIPALQEFLEKRALYEQEQIQKAKESEVEHEMYNFEDLGVDGRLVMQRAINESESYIGNKRRLLAEIEAIQTDRDSVEKEFDEENRGYQRNLRDIREEIAKFKAQIETATNEIQRSSLRRQQTAAVEKAESVEKEIEKASNKFNEKVAKLDAEIDKKKQEIEQSKNTVEKALTDEFKHFTAKTYEDLKEIADKEVAEEVAAIKQEKDDISLILEEKEKLMAEKLALYEDKASDFDKIVGENDENKAHVNELEEKVSNLNQELESKDYEIFEIKKELESRKREILKKDEMIENYKKKNPVEIYRYFDANGNEFYFDDNENPYYLDENGNAVYYDGGENVEYQEGVEENYEAAEGYEYQEGEEVVEEGEVAENYDETNYEEAEQPVEEQVEYVENEEAVEEQPVEEASVEVVEEIEKTEEVAEKPKKGRKKSVKAEKEEVADVMEQPVEVNEEATDDISVTLNKLAKAAEEKVKTAEKKEKAQKSSKAKSSSKKKSSKK